MRPKHQDRLRGAAFPAAKCRCRRKKDGGEGARKPRARRSATFVVSAIPRLRWSSGCGRATACGSPIRGLGPGSTTRREGLLLKFSGDVVYLVLIRGSNLDKPLADGSINLTHAGLQRHRVLWIREMTEEEIERVGETGPTIDSILIGEFTDHESRREWLKTHAPAFLGDPS